MLDRYLNLISFRITYYTFVVTIPVVRGPFNTAYPASLNVFVNSFTFSLLPTEKQYAHILLFLFVMHPLSLPAS